MACGNGSEELSACACLALDGNALALYLSGVVDSFLLCNVSLVLLGGFLSVKVGKVFCGSFNCKTLADKEISCVAVGNFLYFALFA